MRAMRKTSTNAFEKRSVSYNVITISDAFRMTNFGVDGNENNIYYLKITGYVSN
ncbi:MAG: hypothetical protein ACRD8Z_06420 [Nitrososphaeraceae archaeon]